MKIEYNISRLYHLLTLYKMSAEDLLVAISEGIKTPVRREDVFTSEIALPLLKKIDKIFNKGLHYYLDPKAPEASKEASIFFRKDIFSTDLNMEARRIVNHFEEFKISLSAIAKLAEIPMRRTTPVFRLADNPRQVAMELRFQLYPTFNPDKKEFLKAIIKKCAEQNILVFEFVETWNKKEKANIDGFFLHPNVIVLKRQQNSLRREIFTLIHELGHFLLKEEEIESLDYNNLANPNISTIEKWCNDFAYYFLAGDYDAKISSIKVVNSENDYYLEAIRIISKKTHLSKIALYTRLLFQKKISQTNYNRVKADLEEQYHNSEKARKRALESERQLGGTQKGSTPKPINSPLLVSTIQTAFYEGVINEYEVCKSLNIKAEKLYRYIE